MASDLRTQSIAAESLRRNETKSLSNGAILANTGKRTGRSPKDRYIVHDPKTENTVNWGAVNQPISTQCFHSLWAKATKHFNNSDGFEYRYSVGADKRYEVCVNAKTEFAWHQLFVKNLFIECEQQEPATSDWTLLSTPQYLASPFDDGTNSDGAVIINLTERKVLVTGIAYAGEMKKAMFSVMNYILPEEGVLPMHCSSIVDKGDNVSLFFGLSGTGKTTLSSDATFKLIGDDEAGWTPDDTVFNIEGGCYAKCIKLSEESEPVIFNAIKSGCILENVVAQNGVPNFHDDSLTANTRAAYPMNHVLNHAKNGTARGVKNVIFLSCDLYGVLPPVSCLSFEQAIDYFLCGYTAKVGSTELGSSAEISPTFSPCFGAPFFPRAPQVYADLLKQRLQDTEARVFLVNSGFYGPEQNKNRYSIAFTRSIIHSIVSGDFHNTPLSTIQPLGLQVPTHHMSIDPRWFDPRNSWQSIDAYEAVADKLVLSIKKHLKRIKQEEEPTNA